MSDLKPCPFCGEEACYVDETGQAVEISPDVSCGNPRCMPMSTYVPFETWQKRAENDTLSQQQAENDRLTRELAALQERTRWRKYPDEKPDSDEEIPEVYCFRKWTGNEYEIYSRSYWCEFTLLDIDETFYDVCEYNFQYGSWEKHYEGKDLHPIVTRYTLLPEPPEAENE